VPIATFGHGAIAIAIRGVDCWARERSIHEFALFVQDAIGSVVVDDAIPACFVRFAIGAAAVIRVCVAIVAYLARIEDSIAAGL
jgi:hypothetical protein